MCFLSGLFGGVLFNANVLGLLGWVALVPLFMALPLLHGKLLFWATLLFGFTWYYLGVFWLHTLVVFSWLIPIGVAAGAMYYAVYFLLFAFPCAWCCRRFPMVARPWIIAILWTAVEYLRSFTDMAFPWNLLGHSQAPVDTAAMALASVGGVYLITFLMALTNGAIAVFLSELMAARRPGNNGESRARVVAVVVPVIVGVAGALVYGRVGAHRETAGRKMRIAVVQPGISQLQKWNAMMGVAGESEAEFQKRYRDTDILMQQKTGSLIREAARQDKPELVVLPESIFLSGFFPYETELHKELAGLSREIDADLFFGADNRIKRAVYDKMAAGGQHFLSPGDSVTTAPLPTLPVHVAANGTTSPDWAKEPPMAATVAAWQVSPEHGLEARVYNKMQLVPFGEQIPFLSGVDWLRDKLELAGIAGAFKPGMQNTIFEVDGARFGAVICFESTFSYLTRHLAQAGAQFVCVLTNDAWYDPEYARSEGGFWGTLFKIPGFRQLANAGPKQHFAQSQFRAIETGLPVVRSANTGISAIIDGEGRVVKSLPYGQNGFLSAEVSLIDHSRPTMAVEFGEWFGELCLGLWLLMVAVIVVVTVAKNPERDKDAAVG